MSKSIIIEILSDPEKGEVKVFNKNMITIGSLMSDDINLKSASGILPNHITVSRENGNYNFLNNCFSSVYVNGKVSTKGELKHNDELQFGIFGPKIRFLESRPEKKPETDKPIIIEKASIAQKPEQYSEISIETIEKQKEKEELESKSNIEELNMPHEDSIISESETIEAINGSIDYNDSIVTSDTFEYESSIKELSFELLSFEPFSTGFDEYWKKADEEFKKELEFKSDLELPSVFEEEPASEEFLDHDHREKMEEELFEDTVIHEEFNADPEKYWQNAEEEIKIEQNIKQNAESSFEQEVEEQKSEEKINLDNAVVYESYSKPQKDFWEEAQKEFETELNLVNLNEPEIVPTEKIEIKDAVKIEKFEPAPEQFWQEAEEQLKKEQEFKEVEYVEVIKENDIVEEPKMEEIKEVVYNETYDKKHSEYWSEAEKEYKQEFDDVKYKAFSKDSKITQLKMIDFPVDRLLTEEEILKMAGDALDEEFDTKIDMVSKTNNEPVVVKSYTVKKTTTGGKTNVTTSSYSSAEPADENYKELSSKMDEYIQDSLNNKGRNKNKLYKELEAIAEKQASNKKKSNKSNSSTRKKQKSHYENTYKDVKAVKGEPVEYKSIKKTDKASPYRLPFKRTGLESFYYNYLQGAVVSLSEMIDLIFIKNNAKSIINEKKYRVSEAYKKEKNFVFDPADKRTFKNDFFNYTFSGVLFSIILTYILKIIPDIGIVLGFITPIAFGAIFTFTMNQKYKQMQSREYHCSLLNFNIVIGHNIIYMAITFFAAFMYALFKPSSTSFTITLMVYGSQIVIAAL
ncbi:MAG: hypothetical protein AB1782_01390, partial [Cyanobacteriota bacterium]